MPTLDEALPILGAAAIGSPSPVGTAFEGLAPFEAMIAAVLTLHVGPTSGIAVIDALRDEGLLDPEHLDQADFPEIQDAPAREVAFDFGQDARSAEAPGAVAGPAIRRSGGIAP